MDSPNSSPHLPYQQTPIPPTIAEIQLACSQNATGELIRLIDRQDQTLLQEVALSSDAQTAAHVLDRISTTAVYSSETSLGFKRPPSSLIAEQYLLERAANFANVAVMQYVLKRNPELDLRNHILACNATNGGVEAWKVLLRHDAGLKDIRHGHAGTVVEHCVKHGHVDVLRYLLEQGALVEEEDRPVLQVAEVVGASKEIQELLISYGADMGWDNNLSDGSEE